MFTQLSLTEANKNVRQMRVIGVLSLAPMRLSVSWKLHNAFIRNEFLPFLWGLLSPNVYTSPLLLSGFGDFDLQHLLVDWTDAKRTNPLKKRIESSCAKQRRWYLAFQRPPGKQAGNTTACCPAGFAFLIWFPLTLGKPCWFYSEMLPLDITATEVRRQWADTPRLQQAQLHALTALHTMVLQSRCNCWALHVTRMKQGCFFWMGKDNAVKQKQFGTVAVNAGSQLTHCSETSL